MGFYTRAPRSERRGGKKVFRLKNAFPDGKCIARLDEKTCAATACKPLRIDFEKLIASCLSVPPHVHSFRRGGARVAASHRDRFQNIDTTGTAIGHFVT